MKTPFFACRPSARTIAFLLGSFIASALPMSPIAFAAKTLPQTEIERTENPVSEEKDAETSEQMSAVTRLPVVTESTVTNEMSLSRLPIAEVTDGIVTTDEKPVSQPFTITVLSSTELSSVLTEALAEEITLLRPLPVAVLYRGLPVMKDPATGLVRHDKATSEKRLQPLFARGLGAEVDPGVFRRTEKALTDKVPTATALPIPCVLLTTAAGTEIVTGTVSLREAVRVAVTESASPLWRSEVLRVLREAGLTARFDFSDTRVPDIRTPIFPERLPHSRSKALP